MNKEKGNQLRKKIENYSYGLNDYLNDSLKSNTFKGINQNTDEKVVVKVVDLRNRNDSAKDHLNIQIEVLKKLKHNNIIHCLDILSTVNNCYIITQFCDQGDLQNKINLRGFLTQNEAIIYFKQLFLGFVHLANQKYIHGNLKPSSILIKQNVIKISGFSNCRKNPKDITREAPFNKYQSPQSVQSNVFNHKTDIWSLGMILYVLLHGCFPWQFSNKAQFLQRVGKPFSIGQELSQDIKQFLKKTLTNKETRLNLSDFLHNSFVQRIINDYFKSEKYIQGLILNEIIEPKTKKQNNSHHHSIHKVEKQINSQINWMRYLFRLIQRMSGYPEQNSTIILKFIIIRQLSVQYQQLKRCFSLLQNPFGFCNWSEFVQQKDRLNKYMEILKKNTVRYQKIKANYRKFLTLIEQNPGLNYISCLLNENFIVSEYNSFVAIKASLDEIKKLWGRITRQYPTKIKYEKDSPFRFKSQLILLDFLITYYQLNCLLIQDFHRLDYFQKMSKLQDILQYQPADLDCTNLEDIQKKIVQLNILS